MTIEQQKLDERREVLRKLACFTAPAALGKNELPQSILDNLVEHALFLQKTPTQLSKISEIIKLQFRLSFEFDEIKTSIERLLAKNLIVDNNGNYSLEVRNRAALGKTVDEKVNQENQILQKLENHIKTKEPEMSTEMIEQIKSDFRLFLTNFFLLSGAEAVQLIYGNPKAINELIGKVQKKNIFELLPARDELLKKTKQKEFCEFVNLLSEQEKLYLQDLLDRSLQYFTITVDKNCEALLTADFANWNLFVDTNFIYNLLGLNTDRYGFKRKNTEKILDLGKRAKIKFDESFVCVSKDNVNTRIKVLVLFKNRLKSSVASLIRKEIRDYVSDVVKTNEFEKIVNLALNQGLQKDIKSKINKIYPSISCMVREVSK